MLGSSSECSSGCESGWTLYFEEEQSMDMDACSNSSPVPALPFLHPPPSTRSQPQDEDNEEEDMSMVSDASSGPPNLHHIIIHQQQHPTTNNYFKTHYQPHHPHSSSTNSLKCTTSSKSPRHHPYSFPDNHNDTASSPIFPNLLVHAEITSAFQHQFAVFQHPADPLVPSSTPQLHHHYNQWF